MITGYGIAAEEAGESALFDADPERIVRREAVEGSSVSAMAFGSSDRALVALRCGSDVTVLDVVVNEDGRISGLVDKVLVADLAPRDAPIGTRLFVGDQVFGIYTYSVDYPDAGSERLATEVRIHYADGNRVQSVATNRRRRQHREAWGLPVHCVGDQGPGPVR